MTMYTLSSFDVMNNTMHMGRIEKLTPAYYARMLGFAPSTYNSISIPRPVIFDDDYPVVRPTLGKVSRVFIFKRGC